MQTESRGMAILEQTDLRGGELELDLAEMEIESGRLAEARRRFAKMSSFHRETPRALLLRAKSAETEDARRTLATFIHSALGRHQDTLSKTYLAAALAVCGDHQAPLKHMPNERSMCSKALSIRGIVSDFATKVPDLHAEENLGLLEALVHRFSWNRRSGTRANS